MEHKNKCQEEFWSYKFTRNSNLNKKKMENYQLGKNRKLSNCI